MDKPILPQRRALRLRDYDYSSSGLYYITMCIHERRLVLGSIEDGEVSLSPVGRIVERCWLAIPHRLPSVVLDAYVIMPNHMHGIIVIDDLNPKLVEPGMGLPCGTAPGSLQSIIQNFKSTTTRRVNRVLGTKSVLWQRNYYEHIIRNDKSLEEIRGYIGSNPWNWCSDDYFI